jgi:alkylation response protein AidB-like acyl-CoA dehydrogenase
MAEFLVPRTERVRIIETWDTLGMRATASHDIAFDDVALPAEALVHRFGPGPDKPSSFSVGSRAWGLQIPALYLGIAEAARDFALGFADDYQAASLGHAILDAPSVQARIGEIELLLGAAGAQLYGLAERWERNPSLQERLHDEVAITKVVVGRQAVRAVELAVEIVGGHSLDRGHPLERLWRDVRCHAFNPPHADTVVGGLAKAAIAALRADKVREALAA